MSIDARYIEIEEEERQRVFCACLSRDFPCTTDCEHLTYGRIDHLFSHACIKFQVRQSLNREY